MPDLDLQKQRTWGDAYRAAGIEVSFNSSWLASYGAAIRIISERFERHGITSRYMTGSREMMVRAMDKIHALR